jgi:hypothetical protein
MTDDQAPSTDAESEAVEDHVLVLIDWPGSSAAPEERERMMEQFFDKVGNEAIVLAQQVGSSYRDFNAVVIVRRSDALREQLRELKDEGWSYERHDLLQKWWSGRDGKWRIGTNPLFEPGG